MGWLRKFMKRMGKGKLGPKAWGLVELFMKYKDFFGNFYEKFTEEIEIAIKWYKIATEQIPEVITDCFVPGLKQIKTGFVEMLKKADELDPPYEDHPYGKFPYDNLVLEGCIDGLDFLINLIGKDSFPAHTPEKKDGQA